MAYRKGASPEAAATDLEARETIGIGNAEVSKASPHDPQAPARLVVGLELEAARPDLSYRRLHFLLKRLFRQHRIRCIAIGPDRGRP